MLLPPTSAAGGTDPTLHALDSCLAVDGYFLVMAGVLLPLVALRRIERRQCTASAAGSQAAGSGGGVSSGSRPSSGGEPTGPVLCWGAPGWRTFWEPYLCSCIAWHAVCGLQATRQRVLGALVAGPTS